MRVRRQKIIHTLTWLTGKNDKGEPNNLVYKDVIIDLSRFQILFISGEITWQVEAKERFIGKREQKFVKHVRDAKFLDSTGAINISVWGESLIKQLQNHQPYRLLNVSVNMWNQNLQIQTTDSTSTRRLPTTIMKNLYDVIAVID